jgi:hypothetical protein
MPKKTKKDTTGGGVSAAQLALGGSDKSPHKVWSGTLSFGLISMPVSLLTAATEERISFNQLHKECNSRIKQKLFCTTCEKDVERTDLVRGYEHEKDKYLIVTDAELEDAEPESAKVLKLTEFVPASEIDPIFYESTYYLAAHEGRPDSIRTRARRHAQAKCRWCCPDSTPWERACLRAPSLPRRDDPAIAVLER